MAETEALARVEALKALGLKGMSETEFIVFGTKWNVWDWTIFCIIIAVILVAILIGLIMCCLIGSNAESEKKEAEERIQK